jgi:cysteinyl-tRNA synthetase
VRTIRLHDTRTAKLRPLEPRDAGQVGIYACGPTVYSRVHIGNARPFVVFSLLKRFLEHEGQRATLVVNVTDINDKIYVAAREAGRGSAELAAEMTGFYRARHRPHSLGRPDFEPLASETIDGIVELIHALVARAHAYAAAATLLPRCGRMPDYGSLSHRDVEPMDRATASRGRHLKEEPLDFAL